MKLAWLTDIHLNFLNRESRTAFYEGLKAYNVDGFMITGDIGEQSDVEEFLMGLQLTVKKPVYFVLGNHDYYGGSVEYVRKAMDEMMEANPALHYLTKTGPSDLPISKTMILGVDGWADARNGNYKGTLIELNDSNYINELWERKRFRAGMGNINGDTDPLFEKMRELADADAAKLAEYIEQAIIYPLPQEPEYKGPKINRLIILTHVPPFEEVAYYRGKVSEPDFLPFYTSKATGDVLLSAAKTHSDVHFEVYCGHTHGSAYAKLLPNLEAFCGESDYEYPKIQKVIRC